MTRPSKWSVSHVKTRLAVWGAASSCMNHCWPLASWPQNRPNARQKRVSTFIYRSAVTVSVVPSLLQNQKGPITPCALKATHAVAFVTWRFFFTHFIWSLRRTMHIVPRVHCTTEIKVGFITEPHRSKSLPPLSLVLRTRHTWFFSAKHFPGSVFGERKWGMVSFLNHVSKFDELRIVTPQALHFFFELISLVLLQQTWEQPQCSLHILQALHSSFRVVCDQLKSNQKHWTAHTTF